MSFPVYALSFFFLSPFALILFVLIRHVLRLSLPHIALASARVSFGLAYALSFSLLALSLVLHIPIRRHVLRLSFPRIAIYPPSLTLPNIYIDIPSRMFSPGPSSSPAPASITITLTLIIALLAHPHFMFSISLRDLTSSTPLAILTLPHLHLQLPIVPTRRGKTTFHALRIRVFSSACVPVYVQLIREAIVKTTLLGTIERAGNARLDIAFGQGITRKKEGEGEPVGEDGKGEEKEDDDLLLMQTAENLIMHDRADRLYTFRSVSACLRRTWGGSFPGDDEGEGNLNEGRGVFDMEVEDVWWLRCDEGTAERRAAVAADLDLDDVVDEGGGLGLQEETPLSLSWGQLLRDPMSAIDLHFPQASVSFDAFRIRDAEFVRWAFEKIAKGVGVG